MKRTGLKRTSPMARSTALTRTAMKRKATRRPKLDPALREQVWAFAGGLCDMCGLPLPGVWECHHRRLRSQGGQDEPENLLALHDACHEMAHHNRSWARDNGYIVHRGDDPATRPVRRHGASWQLPTSDGWVASSPPTYREDRIVTAFYLSVDCTECDEEIIYGPCATTIEHDGLPVIPFDMAAQTSFKCEACGARSFTGDFEMLSENDL